MPLSHGVIPLKPPPGYKGKKRFYMKAGLNSVEAEQVKEIAQKEDRKGEQVYQKLWCSPSGMGVGTQYDNYQFPGIPAAYTHVMRLIPRIEKGTNRDQRLGSKIDLKAVNCKFFFHIPPATTSTSSTSSFSCRLLVLSPRAVSKYTVLSQNWSTGQQFGNQLLRSGNTATDFSGDLNSLRFPINHAEWITHHDKYFTLNRGLRQGSGDSGCVVPDAVKWIKLNLKVKSVKPRYGNDAETEPDNYCPIAVLLYAPNNGSETSPNPGAIHGNCFTEVSWRNLT